MKLRSVWSMVENILNLFPVRVWGFDIYSPFEPQIALIGSISIGLWVSGEMIVTSSKYHVQEKSQSMYETQMVMIVRKFQKDDVGSYRCIAKNSLGEVDSSIRLYGECIYFCKLCCVLQLRSNN